MIHTYIYIYIYTYVEREGERERERERSGHQQGDATSPGGDLGGRVRAIMHVTA